MKSPWLDPIQGESGVIMQITHTGLPHEFSRTLEITVACETSANSSVQVFIKMD
jgi:hypothetical protein